MSCAITPMELSSLCESASIFLKDTKGSRIRVSKSFLLSLGLISFFKRLSETARKLDCVRMACVAKTEMF